MASERDYTRKFNGVLAMTITDLETGIIRAQRLPTIAKDRRQSRRTEDYGQRFTGKRNQYW